MCVSERQTLPKRTFLTRLRTAKERTALKLKSLDPVKMGYLRTSFIFGAAVLITWIPSSINRLYSLTSGGKISFRLSVASGSVLPLQGVWNAIIFFSTSWGITKAEIARYLPLFFRQSPDKRGTMRMESRAMNTAESRPTLERCRIPSVKFRESTHSDVYEIELEERMPSRGIGH